MGQTSQDKAYEVLKHTLTRSLGIAAAARANARMRMRVLSRVSLGGKSVPVGSAKDKKKHLEVEEERENYRRHGLRARAAFAAHSNNCIYSSYCRRCRGGHLRDPMIYIIYIYGTAYYSN